jgi:hypothetical protein
MATLSSKARPLGVATSAQGALADTAMQPVGIDDNATSTALVIDASGNVQVNGGGSFNVRDDGSFIKEAGGLQIGNTSGTGTTRPIRFYTESAERLQISASGNVALTGNETELQFYSTYTVGSNDRAKIKAIGEGGGSGYGGSLTFHTKNPSNVYSERMRIDSAGTVDMPGYVSAGNMAGTIMATQRVGGGYGTGNSASAAVTSTSEGANYIVTGSRHTTSSNVTNVLAQVTYGGSVRAINVINAGTGISVTESAGVISVNNTGAAANITMSFTRVY